MDRLPRVRSLHLVSQAGLGSQPASGLAPRSLSSSLASRRFLRWRRPPSLGGREPLEGGGLWCFGSWCLLGCEMAFGGRLRDGRDAEYILSERSGIISQVISNDSRKRQRDETVFARNEGTVNTARHCDCLKGSMHFSYISEFYDNGKMDEADSIMEPNWR